MSASERKLRSPATVGGFGDAAVVLAGLGLLMWRVVAPASILTPATLALLYAVVLSMSLTGSPDITSRPVPAISAAVLGAAAVTATRFLAGPAFGSVNMASAFPLGIAAAIAEEAFFRRFLYSRLERAGGMIAVAVSALLFAAIHIPMYGWGAFPIDLAAGLLLSWQRWASGSWLAPASTHILANILAVIR